LYEIRATKEVKTAFAARLRTGESILLDGGLATQLEEQGCEIGNDLWSSSLLMTDSQSIVDASRAYLDAGAEIIASASYQASRQGFARLGASADVADSFMLLSIELATRARDDFLVTNPGADPTPMIAASLGTYGAAQHDG